MDEKLIKKQYDKLNINDWFKPKNVSINISDLVEDHTIDGRESQQIRKTNDLFSFNASEFTGRSTTWLQQQQQQQQQQLQPTRPSISTSVHDILARSCSEDVRNRISFIQDQHQPTESVNASLPFTAKKNTIDDCKTKNNNFSWNCEQQTLSMNNIDNDDDEQFMSADHMKTKLYDDEKSWLNQYALIPQKICNETFNTAGTGDAIDNANGQSSKYLKNSKNASIIGNYSSASALKGQSIMNNEFTMRTIINDDGSNNNNNNNNNNDNGTGEQFSIGEYFSAKCMELREMIPNPSPTKLRKPIALIDDYDDDDNDDDMEDNYAMSRTKTNMNNNTNLLQLPSHQQNNNNNNNTSKCRESSMLSISDIKNQLSNETNVSITKLLNAMYLKSSASSSNQTAASSTELINHSNQSTTMTDDLLNNKSSSINDHRSNQKPIIEKHNQTVEDGKKINIISIENYSGKLPFNINDSNVEETSKIFGIQEYAEKIKNNQKKKLTNNSNFDNRSQISNQNQLETIKNNLSTQSSSIAGNSLNNVLSSTATTLTESLLDDIILIKSSSSSASATSSSSSSSQYSIPVVNLIDRSSDDCVTVNNSNNNNTNSTNNSNRKRLRSPTATYNSTMNSTLIDLTNHILTMEPLNERKEMNENQNNNNNNVQKLKSVYQQSAEEDLQNTPPQNIDQPPKLSSLINNRRRKYPGSIFDPSSNVLAPTTSTITSNKSPHKNKNDKNENQNNINNNNNKNIKNDNKNHNNVEQQKELIKSPYGDTNLRKTLTQKISTINPMIPYRSRSVSPNFGSDSNKHGKLFGYQSAAFGGGGAGGGYGGNGQQLQHLISGGYGSQYSSTSEFNCNEWPLKASHDTLSWGSIKLRKSSEKSTTIKNISDRRLSFKMEIIGPGFQLIGTEQSCIITLQANECRTIKCIFCPTVIGPAIGKLHIQSTIKDSSSSSSSAAAACHQSAPMKKSCAIYLFGYGGTATILLQTIEKGPIGPKYLKLGEMKDLNKMSLNRTFQIYNRGPLNGFFIIQLKSKTNQHIIQTCNISIAPRKSIINAGQSIIVNIGFRPKRCDIKKFLQNTQSDVITIGILEIIYGDDPNRQRLAGMMLKKRTDNPSMFSTVENILYNYPNEQAINFNGIKDNTKNITEFFSLFKTDEIALTINRSQSLNETNEMEHDLLLNDCVDETIFFKTLQPDDTLLLEDNINNNNRNHNEEHQHLHHDHQSQYELNRELTSTKSSLTFTNKSYTIYPTKLLLNDFKQIQKYSNHHQHHYTNPSEQQQRHDNNNNESNIFENHIFLKNNLPFGQVYEIKSNYRHLLQFKPQNSVIKGNATLKINIILDDWNRVGNELKSGSKIFIIVRFEMEKFKIPIEFK